MIRLVAPASSVDTCVNVGGSKSLSNRLLVLKKSLGLATKLENLSDSDDTLTMLRALKQINLTESGLINTGHAGTTFRFLTALLSVTKGSWTLTGSEQLSRRPVKELVEALNEAGAEIKYAHTAGFPPLIIKGVAELSSEIKIHTSVSSQFVSALLLLAPALPTGLKIKLIGKPVSQPYIAMSIGLLKEFGVTVVQENDFIHVYPHTNSIAPESYTVESDWSSASYWYSICALQTGSTVLLKHFFSQSLQGDSVLVEIFKSLGVRSEFISNGLRLTNTGERTDRFEYDFSGCPDLAQTIAVTCMALGVPAKLKGLETLPLKETNRVAALKNELEKFGARVIELPDAMEIVPPSTSKRLLENVVVNTYHDHRLAMSFAPLAMVCGSLCFDDETVVSKSYPRFWEDLKSAGFDVNLQP